MGFKHIRYVPYTNFSHTEVTLSLLRCRCNGSKYGRFSHPDSASNALLHTSVVYVGYPVHKNVVSACVFIDKECAKSTPPRTSFSGAYPNRTDSTTHSPFCKSTSYTWAIWTLCLEVFFHCRDGMPRDRGSARSG